MNRLPEALHEHLQRPRNVGEPPGGHDLRGEARNEACRDHVVLYLGRERDEVVRAGFRATGCPAALGIASAVTELLPGLAADEGLPGALRVRYIAHYGEPAALHRHALALVLGALKDAMG